MGHGHILSAYLVITNPIHFDTPALNRAQLSEVLTAVAIEDGADSESGWRDSFLSNCINTYEPSLSLHRAVQVTVPHFLKAPTLIHQLGGIIGAGVSAHTVNVGVHQVLGYDGYYANGFSNKGDMGGHIWVAMFTHQIHSLGPIDLLREKARLHEDGSSNIYNAGDFESEGEVQESCLDRERG